jgi:Ca2+-binding EF-hand superfamily protein
VVLLRKYLFKKKKQKHLFFSFSNFFSFDDLWHVMQRLGENLTKADIKEMMREADRDLDGKISLPEFIEMIRYS